MTEIADLDLKPFELRGYLGLRRTHSFGSRYDYVSRRLGAAEPIPSFLLSLRDKAAAFAGRLPEAFVQALVTEYAPGAPIGWHRDKPQFGEIVGVSLLSPCVFRLRRRNGAGWDRAACALAPRSVYEMSGDFAASGSTPSPRSRPFATQSPSAPWPRPGASPASALSVAGAALPNQRLEAKARAAHSSSTTPRIHGAGIGVLTASMAAAPPKAISAIFGTLPSAVPATKSPMRIGVAPAAI